MFVLALFFVVFLALLACVAFIVFIFASVFSHDSHSWTLELRTNNDVALVNKALESVLKNREIEYRVASQSDGFNWISVERS